MKPEKKQNRGRKSAKILAAMLVFLLCGCNHRSVEYKLADGINEIMDKSAEKETSQEESIVEESNGKEMEQPEKETGKETEKAAEESGSQDRSQTGFVQVYICGAVASPGVYTLPAGSRVVQAVEAAGGFLPDAEDKILNQARKVEDGEQITVWTREEAKEYGKAESVQQNVSGETAGESGGLPGNSSGKINLNTAGKEELMTLSGIGESRAEAIIAYRETNGSFQKIEDIMNVEGIKEKMFEKIRGSIEV